VCLAATGGQGHGERGGQHGRERAALVHVRVPGRDALSITKAQERCRLAHATKLRGMSRNRAGSRLPMENAPQGQPGGMSMDTSSTAGLDAGGPDRHASRRVLYARISAQACDADVARAEHLLLRALARQWPEAWIQRLLYRLLRRSATRARDSGPVRERLEQPAARDLPVALDGRGRELERLGGFLDRQAAEVAQCDDPSLSGVDALERFQRAVERGDIDAVAVAGGQVEPGE